jgi:Uma2 family endonuclease
MTATKLLTAEDLWAMPEVPGKQFELVNGELIEVPGATFTHGLIAAVIYRLMIAFATERGLGIAVPDGVAFILQHAPAIVRIPDAAFISMANIPADGVPSGFFPAAPDIAVEVVSVNDLAKEVDAKVEQYLAFGTRLVWVVWPDARAVTVHTPDRLARRLHSDDVLDGADVLSGFAVPVANLFDIEPRR